MDYRRAQSERDFQQIVELQNKNLSTTLTEENKKDGFLSAAFTVKQLQDMNNDLCVMTCFDNSYLCGYIATSTVEYNQQFPLVRAMIDKFPQITYQNKVLSDYKSFIPGPVCVDSKYRGHEVFPNLTNKVFDFLAQQANTINLGIVLVSSSNLRSINAHKKVGWETVDEFKFENKDFLILVRPV